MSQPIQEKLLNFISESFGVESEEIDLNKSLMDEGIIDSTGFIEIIAFLEEEYSIEIEEDQMTKDNFGSVIKIADFVERLTLPDAAAAARGV